jgi:putative ABC transport system permease protein
MFRNYLTIVLRTLAKRRLYSAITIIGLAIGITFALFIGSYTRIELLVNTTLKNADCLYIVQSSWKEKDMGLDMTTMALLGKTLKEPYPSMVSKYYRLSGIASAVSANNQPAFPGKCRHW